MSATPHEIRTQLREMGLLSEQRRISDAESLMDAGALDSIRLMELVTRLEQKFGIAVDQDDLIPENFDSIAGIAHYVESRSACPTR